MQKEDRWTTQKREIARSIKDLASRTMFGLVVWGDRVTAFRKTLVPASEGNKLAALQFVNSRRLSVGQAMSEGLLQSLRMFQNSDRKHRAVVLTSDGRPNNTDNGQLFSDSAAANPGGKVNVHTIRGEGARSSLRGFDEETGFRPRR